MELEAQHAADGSSESESGDIGVLDLGPSLPAEAGERVALGRRREADMQFNRVAATWNKRIALTFGDRDALVPGSDGAAAVAGAGDPEPKGTQLRTRTLESVNRLAWSRRLPNKEDRQEIHHGRTLRSSSGRLCSRQCVRRLVGRLGSSRARLQLGVY